MTVNVTLRHTATWTCMYLSYTQLHVCIQVHLHVVKTHGYLGNVNKYNR